jgi:ribosomal protein S18 acetylase RimI-like enzyme
MGGMGFEIRPFLDTDRADVVSLWEEVFAGNPPWNAPADMIRRKKTVQPELFFVARSEGEVIGTVMGRFDGVIGWIHHPAVSPSQRRSGVPTRLMRAAEAGLVRLGCAKANLQVRSINSGVIAFYQAIGYEVEERVSMGKRLTDGA